MTMPNYVDHCVNCADAELRGREQERAAVVAAVRQAMSESYRLEAPGYCLHGVFMEQDCIACYDDALEAKLVAIEAGEHITAPE
jgi:hypothetical protein